MTTRQAAGLIRRYGLTAVGLGGVVALVIAVNPGEVRRALAGADAPALAAMPAVVLALYLAHGAAWWLALRGARLRVGLGRAIRTVLMSQAFDVVPGGDLWRVPIVAGEEGESMPSAGVLTATVVFDDLVYFFVLSAAMLPAGLRFGELRAPLALALLPQVLIFTLLLWPRAYDRVAGVVARMPAVRDYRSHIAVLGPSFRRLMHPRTLLPVILVDAVCAGLAVALYWLALIAVHAPGVGLQRAAFTYAATQVLSGLTVLPGAVGAYEALSTGVLAAQGAPPASAAAAALLYRVVNDLLMALLGLLLILRRRSGLPRGGSEKALQVEGRA